MTERAGDPLLKSPHAATDICEVRVELASSSFLKKPLCLFASDPRRLSTAPRMRYSTPLLLLATLQHGNAMLLGGRVSLHRRASGSVTMCDAGEYRPDSISDVRVDLFLASLSVENSLDRALSVAVVPQPQQWAHGVLDENGTLFCWRENADESDGVEVWLRGELRRGETFWFRQNTAESDGVEVRFDDPSASGSWQAGVPIRAD